MPPRPRADSQASWRAALQALPAQPPRNTTVQYIEDIIRNIHLAEPSFAFQTSDYEANRELVRRLVTYLGALDAMTSEPQMRAEIIRAYAAVAALNLEQPAPAGPPARTSSDRFHELPFSMRAPAIQGVAPEDRKSAEELAGRYVLAATQSAAAWQSADTLRRSLERQGMSLNASTTVSLSRIQLYFELASEDLLARDWLNAKTNIERAEYETRKVFNTVGH